MRPTTLFLVLSLTILLTAMLIGCGGNASPRATSTPTPTPTPTSPMPTPPAPTPPATPPGGTSGTVQFQVTLHNMSGGTNPMGSASVTTNGDVAIQLTGGSAGASYNVNFCLFPATIYLDNCMTNLATIVSDSGGNGQVSFHFPKSGTWAGIFRIMNGTSIFAETSGDNTTFSSSGMQLEPATTTNPQGAGQTGTQDPGSGTVSAAGGTAHVVLTGAVANASYGAIVCYMGGSSCYSMGTVNTDAGGNGTADLKISGAGIAVFEVERNNAAGFVTGFKVP